MVEIAVKNWQNQEIGKQTLNTNVFACEVREDILHRVVQWQLSKARLGCHKVKQRNEVSGSTRKLFKQKGRGGARHGSIKAPIFVGGGIVFGPVVRSHEYSLNKKVRKLGLKGSLSLKCHEKSIIVLDSIELDSYKTSNLKQKLHDLGVLNESVLIIDTNIDQNLINACANMSKVDVLPVVGLNVYDILRHKVVIIAQNALGEIEKRLV